MIDYFNNLYNFKNPIRHFFNLDNFNYDSAGNGNINDLAWTAPVTFKIFKNEHEERVISFPNILNYYHTLNAFSKEENFYKIQHIGQRKRVCPDIKVGEFSVMSYSKALQRDAFNLTKYDKLLILDIKSFYGRLYTHDLNFNSSNDLERRLTSLNKGRTSGILLGSYLSLFVAEKYLKRIEDDLIQSLKDNDVSCYFEYFSDDFYFFCGKNDLTVIQKVFESVLEKFELQINHEKTKVIDFEEYMSENSLEKIWKKVVKISQEKDKELENRVNKIKPKKIHPAFFTQLVYRLKQIEDIKYKRIFLSNFFKTYYFYSIKSKNYVLSDSDLNYIFYIYKLMPETILYSLYKIKEMNGFNLEKFKDFVISRFRSALANSRNDEQVYLYYAIKVCGFIDVLVDFKELVMKSRNQVLISYFLLDKIILKDDYICNGVENQEDKWLQNYHYLLLYDKDNVDLLLPQKINRESQKESYRLFYKKNLDNGIPILKPIEEVSMAIDEFISNKIDSYRSLSIDDDGEI